MSLINDALRKARKAQAAIPVTARGPDLQPVSVPARTLGPVGITLWLIIATVVLLAGIMLGEWYRAGHAELMVRAATRPPAASPALLPVAATPEPVVEPASAPSPAAAIPEISPTPVAVPAAREPAPNEAAVVTPPIPVMKYQLQALFIGKKRPAALINGETVFVGGHVGDARVVAIDKESATIVTAAGKTNVLEMAN